MPTEPAPGMRSMDTTIDGSAVRPTVANRALQFAFGMLRLGPVLILLAIAVIASICSPYFLTERNLQNLGTQTASTAVLALGQLLVVVTRGIDLSVGSIVSLCTVVGALAFVNGYPSPVVIGAMLLIGAGIGLLNGTLLVATRIPHPFIITLGSMNITLGVALVLSGGIAVVGMPLLIKAIGTSDVCEVPVAVLIALGWTLSIGVLVRALKWGRWIFAVGGNPEAAARAGMPVGCILVSTYLLSGLSASVAAIIIAGRTNAGDPVAGSLLELDAIAAVIIGGASFFGGRGSVVGAIAGALVIGVIRNALNLLNVSPYIQLIAIGSIVILAVLLDVVRLRLETKVRSLRAEGLS
jgi:ribose transport system permease protein